MLRKLGIFEQAMLIANEHAPFNIVSVLRMEDPPPPDAVENALQILLKRYPVLQARIVNGFYETIPSPHIPFAVIERTGGDQWQSLAEEEMAFQFNHGEGPLIRASYLYKDGFGDLVLNVHHDIMDAVSGMNLLDELLHLCSGQVSHLPVLVPAPAMETRFPPGYRGVRGIINTAGYAFRQMADMSRYLWRARNERRPPVRLGGRGRIITLILNEELVDSLSRRCRKAGITLHSLLNAALVLSVNRHLYNGQSVTTRTFSFADLRPYTLPPTPPEMLANYIAMLGYSVDVSANQDVWGLARDIHAKIYHALKRGDKFNAVLLSKFLLKMITKTKSMRFGATALNYSGNVPLKTQYEDIKLVGFHGFVSGYDLGPEFSSQSRLFNDQVWWDFIYLDTDMDPELAEKIISEIEVILKTAAQT